MNQSQRIPAKARPRPARFLLLKDGVAYAKVGEVVDGYTRESMAHQFVWEIAP